MKQRALPISMGNVLSQRGAVSHQPLQASDGHQRASVNGGLPLGSVFL